MPDSMMSLSRAIELVEADLADAASKGQRDPDLQHALEVMTALCRQRQDARTIECRIVTAEGKEEIVSVDALDINSALLKATARVFEGEELARIEFWQVKD